MDATLLTLPDQLETPRLIVRPYRKGDGGAYWDVCIRNRAHLLPFEAGNPALNVETVGDAEALIREFAADWATRRLFFFGGWQKQSGAFACQVTVVPVNSNVPELEVGYFVDHRCEGQGFVTEAVRAVLGLCFDQLGAHRVRLRCNELNLRSQRVAERCGFVREGHVREVHREIVHPDGRFSGDYLYGLLHSEFVR